MKVTVFAVKVTTIILLQLQSVCNTQPTFLQSNLKHTK